MNINEYKYLWEKGNYDNVLIKGNVGYMIFNRANNSLLAIENEVVSQQIIEKMLENGNPIYESIKDLKNNSKPINIVGQASEFAEFPVKRYKVSIQWSKGNPLTAQVKNLKTAFPVVNVKSNQELLEIAKSHEIWHFDTIYLDSDGINELLNRGKEKQLNILIEPDDLKESF